ncbi:hypothetical protein IFM89_018923 [Coptis chinensis]|uniref:Protein LURP-one-related 6 n=1 Tax=Coptis chinensis TaxID=261450 RepID=A0A835HFM5_9MAGN|nr:hypothetical protein IFM89_018923 [Coptis chinensis]
MASKANVAPIVSKMYCSSSQANFIVRRRPHVVNGGGFVVTNYSQNVAFRVDGCGTLGVEGEAILKNSDGESLLVIRRKAHFTPSSIYVLSQINLHICTHNGGLVQALSINRQWRGYKINYEGVEKLVFSLKEPVVCIIKKIPIRIKVEPGKNNWDFEVKGSFPDRACTIIDSEGNIVAQVGVKNDLEEMILCKDLYHVVVQPGCDQAFVFGVIAILDNIHGETTVC